jgi:hypothetical protein
LAIQALNPQDEDGLGALKTLRGASPRRRLVGGAGAGHHGACWRLAVTADFDAVYAELRALMLRAATDMRPATDIPRELQMLAPWPHPRKPKTPMWFGMVRQGRAYVSYHLLPLYMNAGLQAQVSPALARRKQGKACFNFKVLEPALLAELEVLTRTCAAAFAKPLVF